MQSLKNFLIAFGVGLVIFGIFAFAAISLMGNDEDEKKSEPAISNSFASGDPLNPEISESGNTFTALVGGYDSSGEELDALIFIKADRENMRFVISSIPTNLLAPVTSSPNLPADGTENINLQSDISYVENYVRLKDFPSRFPGETQQMVVDTVTFITGMPIDYYAFLDYGDVTSIFKRTGGLNYEITRNMVYIGNGTEDMPEISLKKNDNIINANKAIALMRYTDCIGGEYDFNERARRQADFLSSAMIQVLRQDPEKIITGLGEVLQNCETNFTLDDFKDNFELISKFSEYRGNNVIVSFDNYRSEVLNYEDVSQRFAYYK